MILSIGVYCSSSSKIDDSYINVAVQVGELIAAGRLKLVYGGGNIGLMGTLARSVKENGGQVTGVNLELFVEKGLCYRDADEIIICKTMSERKQIMEDRSDAFIVLPGGFGTLEEFSEVLTLKQLHFHNKPIVLLNINGFYSNLLAWMDNSFRESFIKDKYRSLYHAAENPEEAFSYIRDYTPVEYPVKWYD
jgi:uncharacterized protein (TIGR00730 family)